jgi:molybdopterin synthase catalytic subunit
MEVTVLYFATLRDHTGLNQELLTLSENATVVDLMEALKAKYSTLVQTLEVALVAVNREYAFPDEKLNDGDEVAIFPPVSGGSGDLGPTVFRITEEPLELNDLLDLVVSPTTGAACVFTGIVRGHTERGGERDTSYLEYEAYKPMAEVKMRQVADEIQARWPSVEGIAIVQRIGQLEAGTPSIMIVCTAAHRDTGVFEAARYGIDRLKQIVPIWKKEVGSEGEVWIEGDYHPVERDRQT